MSYATTATLSSPPCAVPLQYRAPLGTRWEKEKAAAGKGAFDFPDDPKYVGPWMLGECVGKGASGRVKVAQHRRTGQMAAVKILPLQPTMSSRADLATQQAKTRKFRLGVDKEIITMKLMNHPNIMRIYDVYEGDNELYLILEYVQGGELFDYLVNRGRMAPLEALAYFKQIVGGLSYAHAFSIIHRDLKPENILIAQLDPPLVKIADWGMAAFAPPTSHLETSCGSPHYASPEIVNGDKYTGTASDIWSCGVILYALLTGRLPFDDKNIRQLLSKVKLGRYDIPSYVDPQARDLISRMLVVDAKERISMSDILAHPWLRNDTPGIPYVPAPSVSDLASPITSSRIDPSILQSLRVICARHANLEQIKTDLLSPPGEGSFAKAFYFLLNKHREATLEENGIFMDVDYDSRREKAITKQYMLPPSRSSMQVGRGRLRAAPPTPPPVGPPPVPPKDYLHIASSPKRSRAPSPLGPREPKLRAMSIPEGRAHCLPPPMNTRHRSAPERPTPALHFPQNQRRQSETATRSRATTHRSHAIDIPVPDAKLFDDVPWSQSPPTMHFDIPNDTPDLTMSSESSTPPSDSVISRLPSVIHAPVAVRPGAPGSLAFIAPPRVADADAQRTIDHIAEMVNGLMAKDNDRAIARHHIFGPIDENVDVQDKENWSTPVPRVQGGYDGAHSRKNSMASSNYEYSERQGKKDRKNRPMPLDLSMHKRSTLSAAAVPFSPATPSPPFGSPVVGELKGWFSNLFHWKQSLVLYSVNDIALTRDELVRLLQQADVGVIGEDIGGRLVVRCTVEDAWDPATGAHVKRGVRFRVEFSALGAQGSFHPITPGGTALARKTSRLPPPVAGEYACAIVFVQEKGAVSTFRGVYQRLRAEWQLDGLRSPAPPASPFSPLGPFSPTARHMTA